MAPIPWPTTPVDAGPKFSGADEEFPGDALFDQAPRTRSELVQDALGTGLQVAASTVLVVSVVRSARQVSPLQWQSPAALIAGVYAADLTSGTLHWAFDTWFDRDMPALRRVVLIVREHHIYPQRIFNHGLAEGVGLMAWFGLLGSGPAALGLLVGRPQKARARMTLAVFALSYSVLTTVSLDLHKAGHSFRPGRTVRLAQRAGLVLSPRHHMKHHAGEHDSHYCLVNGWADRTLGALGFFGALESAVAAATSAVPRHDDRRWRRTFGRWVRA